MIVDPIGSGRFIIADERMIGWVSERLNGTHGPRDWPGATAIGLASGDKIIAGMIVTNYSRYTRNCEVSFAADTPKWATKPSIRAMLRYPFEQLGCQRITTVIARSNTRSIRFNEGIGFKQEGVMRLGAGHEDALIFGLLKAEAPAWLVFTQTAESVI